jgi:hypothetical protein
MRARTGRIPEPAWKYRVPMAVGWSGVLLAYCDKGDRRTALTTMFDFPETDFFQKSRALAQYLPRIAM